MRARLSLWFLLVLLASCKYNSALPSVSYETSDYVDAVTSGTETLTVLSVTGGLCLTAGMVLLVVTSGKKGWYPIVGGCIFIVLNYAVARYSDFLFYPLVVCTGMISAAWTYKTITQILLEKKAK
jgi:hypothetical protein|tara:strand:+ start:105 stop:479 length:375 start_codon:yes stop_codon:yes gene_type:complete